MLAHLLSPLWRCSYGWSVVAGFLMTCQIGATELNVLPDKLNGVPKQQMLSKYLLATANTMLDQREQALAKLLSSGDREELARYQQQMREKYRSSLGNFVGFDPNSPINAVVTDTQTKSGYRVEKVRFESQLGHYVTAVLYLPNKPEYACPTQGHPAVLVAMGHSQTGLATEFYQKAAALAAINGLAAFSLEPIEQGERVQLPPYVGTGGHVSMGLGSILVGRNTATFEMWDAMRALDYLQSRNDIDNNRIGVMGNSGGGTQTALLLGLDDRIKAAASVSYITNYRELLAGPGPQDAEQHLFGQIAFGMDHADFLTMFAPTPVMVGANRRDYFPIAGSRTTYLEARQFFQTLDPHAIDRIALIENDDEHGWHQPLREAAVQWISRWLCGEPRTITEPVDLPILTADEIRVSPTGQVRDIAGYRSTYVINADYDRTVLAPRRMALWKQPAAALAEVRKLARVRPLDQLPQLTVVEEGSTQREDYTIGKFIFTTDEGISLPGLLLSPKDRPTAATLYVHASGKATEFDRLEELVRANHLVLALDVRGRGETYEKRGYYTDQWEDGHSNFYTAYLLGQSLVGMRAEDILVAAQWLSKSAANQGLKQMDLIAVGSAVGVPALHAAALERPLFGNVTCEQTLASWLPFLSGVVNGEGSNVIHGALTAYDLPDLQRIAISKSQNSVDASPAISN